MAIGKALAVSFGALAGGAAGFYFLEMYKIKSKVKIKIKNRKTKNPDLF
jgi:outer membrane lipoprotein SlyB